MKRLGGLLKKSSHYVGYLVEKRMLIRRSVMIVITILSAGYAYMGLWIIAHRPPGFITSAECALILAFAGVNGVVFNAYGKNRINNQIEEENNVENNNQPDQSVIPDPHE